MSARTRPITAYTEKLLMHVHFVDVHGRKVGYDFRRIRAMIKLKYPHASASQVTLRYVKVRMNASGVPLPAHPFIRNGSRRKPAREYTRALLMERDERGNGLSFEKIQRKVRGHFPEVAPCSLIHVARYMVRQGFKLPEFRAAKL